MNHSRYDHEAIEKKWQARWKQDCPFAVDIDPDKPKYYVLDMFPYPSGEGLHVGHLVGYTVTDILARYKRQKGFNVLHPMGWDSFGLPAEQYAIRTGISPHITTEKNIARFRQQLQAVGFSYDWSREVQTSDSDYYKWTQWIFTKLYERGLAYRTKMLVNYCPALGTVLANEEVEEGFSKEGRHPIERKPLEQWVLKITDYAERLIDDLNSLDWPDHVKRLQYNWIGKSQGTEIVFREEKTQEAITTFTTRPDTLFGVTYVVLAPEHPLVEKVTTEEKKEQVNAYRNAVKQKSDRERLALEKEKSGVWTGAWAIHPLTNAKLPLWISDYVLSDYGTGAVMAVPAHDSRDFAFAEQYGLPVHVVIAPPASLKEEDEEGCQQILAGRKCWEEEGICLEGEFRGQTIANMPSKQAMGKVAQWLEEAKLGKKVVRYKLRDWLFSRQRYWGEPFPVLYFSDGSQRMLSVDELPLQLPSLPEFTPSTTGESPLAAVKEWIFTFDKKMQRDAERETDTMPQWAGSCWYYLRFCDPHNREKAWSKEAEQYWMNVDMYVGGMEHAVLHLLYARFWHKVLYDCNEVSHKEPFQTYRNIGLVVARSYQKEDGNYVAPDDVEERSEGYFHYQTKEKLLSQIEKMSKSKLNGVSPDAIVEEYGADALRLYAMFMGPMDKEKVWKSEAISGCYRFLQRVYRFAFSSSLVEEEENPDALKLIHRLIADVTQAQQQMHYNTAIAKMMECLNELQTLQTCPQKVLFWFIQLLFPFAPHLSSEIWEKRGGQGAIDFAPLPEADPQYLTQETITYIIQVNGRLRARWELPLDQTKEQLVEKAKQDEKMAHYLTKPIQKVVFVPNKLINIVL